MKKLIIAISLTIAALTSTHHTVFASESSPIENQQPLDINAFLQAIEDSQEEDDAIIDASLAALYALTEKENINLNEASKDAQLPDEPKN